ncbi:MAG: hypothetical protein V3T23_02875, partial [Nitrososphaerales archaeon]
LGLKVDAGFTIPGRLRVDTEVNIQANFRVLAAFDIEYIFPARVGGQDFEVVYDLGFDKVTAPFGITAPLKVQASTEITYNLLSRVNAPFDITAGLNIRVNAPFDVDYRLRLRDRVTRPSTVVYTLVEETGVNVTDLITLTLVRTGEVIPIEGGEVEISEGANVWTGSLVLAKITDADKFVFDDDVILDLNGEIYEMVVDSIQQNRIGPTQVSALLRVLSKSARFDTPRAAEVTQIFDTPINAQAAAEILLGTTIDWRTVDWLLPANRFGVENASALDAVAILAEAVGAALETNPDGTLYVRDQYEVRVSDYLTVTPSHVFLAQDSVLAIAETLGPQEIVNKLRIRDDEGNIFQDRMEFEPDTDNELVGTMSIFPSPFRDMDLDTTRFNPPIIILSKTGAVELTKVEEVEIIEGEGTVNFPIFAIDSIQYLDVDLGALTFDIDSSTVRSSDLVNKFSLVEITYRTRAIQFRVESTENGIPAQFLAVDPIC